MIECRHEVSRTSLRSFIGRVGMVTLILAMLSAFFVFAGIRGALNEAVPHGSVRFEAIVICFVVAIACALVAAVTGRLTYKCMRAASREW